MDRMVQEPPQRGAADDRAADVRDDEVLLRALDAEGPAPIPVEWLFDRLSSPGAPGQGT